MTAACVDTQALRRRVSSARPPTYLRFSYRFNSITVGPMRGILQGHPPRHVEGSVASLWLGEFGMGPEPTRSARQLWWTR
jgi:hypothetical protein